MGDRLLVWGLNAAAVWPVGATTDWITAVAYSPDGSNILTTGYGWGGWLWDTSTGRLVAR